MHYIQTCENGAKKEQFVDKIHGSWLTNADKKDLDFFKLLPTQHDRPAFFELVARKKSLTDSSASTKAYLFFLEKLQALKNLDVEKLKRALLDSFYLVTVELEQDDNPYAIFEGLNTKSRAVTQMDLLRSYVLSRLSPEKQERAFRDLWHPMASRLSGNMPLFFEHFLIRDCATVREAEDKFYLGDYAAVRAYNLYFTVKSRCDHTSEAEVMEYLETLARFSAYYAQFIHPETCPHPRLREALLACASDISVCRPFLLSVFERLSQKTLREEEVVEIVFLLKKCMRFYGPDDISTDALTQIFVWLDYQMGSDKDVCCQLKKWVAECQSVKNKWQIESAA